MNRYKHIRKHLKDAELEEIIQEEINHAKRNKIPSNMIETYVNCKIETIQEYRYILTSHQIKVFIEKFKKGMRS